MTAQTFTNLHNFSGVNDGASLYSGLILSGNTLYGTANLGGSSDDGTVFKLNTDGTGFTNLHSFTDSSHGAGPLAGLILSGNILYGTTQGGGSPGKGTVFKINTDGTGFTNLHSFTSSDGAGPVAGLILSGNTLYGTTFSGGSSDAGTVFAVNADGTAFSNLHSFTATSGPDPAINSDGAKPQAGLIISGNTLYGTTYEGGANGNGTVFAVNTNGSGFTNLHNFTASQYNSSLGSFTNSDGFWPYAGLILSGNTLYGTASVGGSSGNGTVFKVNTDGTDFTTLYHFTATPYYSGYANSDGAIPFAGLILSGNALYGTAAGGGSSGGGTVFSVNTDGTGFSSVYSFTSSDGANPYAGLILSGNTLYGTTLRRGSSGGGTVFSLSLESASAPQLTITPSGANVILTWPTNDAGFTLQSTTNLVSPAVWGAASPEAVVVNGENTVTNPTSGPQNYYRLSQ